MCNGSRIVQKNVAFSCAMRDDCILIVLNGVVSVGTYVVEATQCTAPPGPYFAALVPRWQRE